MTLGQNIQNARKAKGMSQEVLAEKIGVSRQALGKWEKDTALPGLDNLQALAAELGTGVDALLGAQAESPAAPAVTLDALRDLLAARDAEEKRRRRLWGGAAGAAFLVLAGLLAGTALQYERQINALNQNYAAIQSSYAAQQADLSAQISELQDAVRMGETTVLDWRWLPADKLHRDAAGSWMPVQVQVTPRTAAAGTSARLAVRCGDDTQLYEMTAAPDGSFAADGIVFTVGSTYELSVQWTVDGVTTNETLGTVDFNDEMNEPQIIWGAVGSSLDFGYSVRRVGNKQYRLTLTCYPVEVQVDAPPWMQPAQAEIDLLGKTDLRTTAVVSGQNPAKSASRPMPLGIYASARIELTEYRPNYLKYEYTLPEEAVAVFSEIFYDQGWKAYVDGEESPYFRADYVLRAMTLPAGTHTVEWRFRAPGWTAVEGVTLAASLAILLGAVTALVYCFRKRTEKEK